MVKVLDKIDVKVALSVFDKITRFGEKQSSAFLLRGVYATPSFDGYTVSLNDGKVTLDIHFHNKFTIDYDSKKSLNEFMLKLDRINESF